MRRWGIARYWGLVIALVVALTGCDGTETPTGTLTVSPLPTDTPVPTATDTPEPTATDTPEPTATDTPEPTATDTPEPTATDTPEPTATDTPEPTATDTPEPTATDTPEPTATDTPEPTATDTPEPTTTSTVESPLPTSTVESPLPTPPWAVTMWWDEAVALYSTEDITATGMMTWEARISETVAFSDVVTMAVDFAELGTGADGTYPIDIDPDEFTGTAQVWVKMCYVWESDAPVYVTDELDQLVVAEQPLCGIPDPQTSQDGRGFWWWAEVDGTQVQARAEEERGAMDEGLALLGAAIALVSFGLGGAVGFQACEWRRRRILKS